MKNRNPASGKTEEWEKNRDASLPYLPLRGICAYPKRKEGDLQGENAMNVAMRSRT